MKLSRNAEKIISLLERYGELSPKQLTEYLGIGRAALHRHLKSLMENNRIRKLGKSPLVYYSLPVIKIKDSGSDIKLPGKKYVEENFAIVTPNGKLLEGLTAFKYWCSQRGLPLEKTAEEFIKTAGKYDKHKKNGLISGLSKVKETFDTVNLDEVYYLDFYSWERFGKTKLGLMVLYAKQSQDEVLINKLIEMVRKPIGDLIKKESIDALGFIPPTEKREIQLMQRLEKELNFGLPVISIHKLKTDIIVPQKSLTKLSEREENASNTMVVDPGEQYKNILLIDDALGSGATMNIVAGKTRVKERVTGKLIGLALTGSFKGFDVISRV